MNSRIFIIVEGQTEEAFVKEILQPWFAGQDIHDVRAIKISTSRGHKGGFVNYDHLKNDVTRLLRGEKNVVVTTFVDYFRLPTNVPGFAKCKESSHNTSQKISCIEQCMYEDIGDSRFHPYVQRHEFEALLFSSNAGFEKFFSPIVSNETRNLIAQFDNPEDINDGPSTAPSKRVLKILPDYEKVSDGNIIALEIGIDAMRHRCPGFRLWLEKIATSAKRASE